MKKIINKDLLVALVFIVGIVLLVDDRGTKITLITLQIYYFGTIQQLTKKISLLEEKKDKD